MKKTIPKILNREKDFIRTNWMTEALNNPEAHGDASSTIDSQFPTLAQYDPKQIDEAVKSLVKKHGGNEDTARMNLAMDLEMARLQ